MQTARERERLALHQRLVDALGSNNVYFQPPPKERMQYPCIRYTLADIDNIRANNKVYLKQLTYTVTFISRNQNTDVPEKIEQIEYCDFNRCYTSDNLYHFVYQIKLTERTTNNE